jgi:monovalent cation/proton antiporter MnhG/PhaG subunit
LSEARELAASALMLVGLFFTLAGSIGLVRLPDFYSRMHAPTKATTLGANALLAAAVLVLPGSGVAIALKAGLVIAFLFLTAPIGAHMLARAARHGGIPTGPETHLDELPPAPPEREGLEPPGPRRGP